MANSYRGGYQGPLAPNQNENVFRAQGGTAFGTDQQVIEAKYGKATPVADTGVNPYTGHVYNQTGSQGQVLGTSTTTNPYDQVKAPSGPSQQEIDNYFSGAYKTYDEAEANLRGQQPGLISEAEMQAKASRGLLENQKLGANEQLGFQEQQTRQTQQAQVGQQRQTLQELQMANQQRFGGASSAGQAAGELQGREFQRNTFQIGQQAQQAVQQIQQQRQVVEREFQQGLQQLEVNKQQAINEIQRRFQDKLLEINARRGETDSEKARARTEALQNLRNAAYQIDVSKAQFQAQLQMQAQQNTQYLDNAAAQYLSAANQGQQGVDQFASQTPTAIPGVGANQGQATSNPQLQGQITGNDEEPGLFGRIRNTFDFNRQTPGLFG